MWAAGVVDGKISVQLEPRTQFLLPYSYKVALNVDENMAISAAAIITPPSASSLLKVLKVR